MARPARDAGARPDDAALAEAAVRERAAAGEPLDGLMLELAAWLGSDAAHELLGDEGPRPAPAEPRAWLLGTTDWTNEAIVRAGVAIARRALPILEKSAPVAAARARARLDAARAMLDDPSDHTAAALVEAARRAWPKLPAGPVEAAASTSEQAAFLVFQSLSARYVQEVEPTLDALLEGARGAGLEDAELRSAVRAEVLPWALLEATVVVEDEEDDQDEDDEDEEDDDDA